MPAHVLLLLGYHTIRVFPHFKNMDPQSDLSKSRRKREMHALQAIGEELVALPKDRLSKLTLPETLREAVNEARRLNQRGARRRQLQYVGRLMREVDADNIQKQLETSHAGSVKEAALLHRAERWRERLLSEDAAVSEFVDAFSGVDVQKLRTILRNAKQEATAGKPPRFYRALYREIRETMSKHDALLSNDD
jgi:ribosome-associated protein